MPLRFGIDDEVNSLYLLREETIGENGTTVPMRISEASVRSSALRPRTRTRSNPTDTSVYEIVMDCPASLQIPSRELYIKHASFDSKIRESAKISLHSKNATSKHPFRTHNLTNASTTCQTSPTSRTTCNGAAYSWHTSMSAAQLTHPRRRSSVCTGNQHGRSFTGR